MEVEQDQEMLIVKVFFNPAPGDHDLDKTLLSLVDIVCTNENEAGPGGHPFKQKD